MQAISNDDTCPYKNSDIKSIIHHFENVDPSTNKKYVEWIVNSYCRNRFRWENFQNVYDLLEMFDRAKVQKLLQGRPADINFYKSIDALRATVERVEDALTPKFKLSKVRFLWAKPFDKNQTNIIRIMLGSSLIGTYMLEKSKNNETINGHAYVTKRYQGKGIGKILYAWIGEQIKKYGLKHVPSDNLTPRAYKLWSKHSPGSTDNHVFQNAESDDEEGLWQTSRALQEEMIEDID